MDVSLLALVEEYLSFNFITPYKPVLGHIFNFVYFQKISNKGGWDKKKGTRIDPEDLQQIEREYRGVWRN